MSCLIPVDPAFWTVLLVVAIAIAAFLVSLGAAAIIKAVREQPPPPPPERPERPLGRYRGE